MGQVPLIQGSYMARGLIANAQNCHNLYPEPNPKDAPFPVSHYPAPGLSVLVDNSASFPGTYCRGLYDASNGAIVAVFGTYVTSFNPGLNPPVTILGELPTNTGNPVSMCDNQTTLVIVDGSPNGWTVPLSSIYTAGSMTEINDPAFYGSTFVDFIDTFLVFNWPGTPTFYTTTSNAVTPFNPLYFAGKEGWNDYLVAARCLHDNIWLIGNTTTEVWFNSGAPDFPWQRMPNSILQQGCTAPYSIVIADNAIYWLSQDRWGRNMLMRGEGYMAARVSNFAVESEWATYGAVYDAVGMVFQYNGHETICLYFPTAQQWWAYDASTSMWHKRTYGNLTTPWLAYCTAGWGSIANVGYPNATIVGDRSAPRLLLVSAQNYTDNGTPIIRQRAWPHIVADGKRQVYTQFRAAFDGSGLNPDGLTLDWSDDGGHTFGQPLTQAAQANTWGPTMGQYQWRRLGYGRDRVFRLTWSGQGEATLNGAWLDAIPAAT